jgi:hypothetical protein
MMWKRAIIILVPAFIAVLLISQTAFCEVADRTGTFTDMARDESTGDHKGCEVRIVMSTEGYAGTIQCAEGWPGPLIMLQNVRYKTRQLFFTVPSGPNAGFFRGRVTALALTGIIELKDGTLLKLSLPRSRGFWE